MAVRLSKATHPLEILHDLARMHDDRVSGYRQALLQVTEVDAGLRGEIDKIISDGEHYKHELWEKISEMTGSAHVPPHMHGKIYNAWRDLKIGFSGITQKSIVDCRLYNEEIALHAYKAALGENTAMEAGARQLIERQESGMRKVNDEVLSYKTSHSAGDYDSSQGR